MKLFKKNHRPKEQRVEEKRREELIKSLYQILLKNCANAQDLKTRVEIVNNQINGVGAKLVKDFQDNLGKQAFSTLGLKAQDGKGSEVEQMIIDLLANEKIEVAQTLLQTWIVTMDAFMRKDMLERSADSLKIEFR